MQNCKLYLKYLMHEIKLLTIFSLKSVFLFFQWFSFMSQISGLSAIYSKNCDFYPFFFKKNNGLYIISRFIMRIYESYPQEMTSSLLFCSIKYINIRWVIWNGVFDSPQLMHLIHTSWAVRIFIFLFMICNAMCSKECILNYKYYI